MKRLLVLGSLIFLVVALILTGCVGKKVNNPPTIEEASLSATSITVDQSVTLSYKVSDPDSDPLTVTVYWGDGQSENFTETEKTVSHKYQSAGNYTVSISVSDGKGGEVSKTVGTVEVSAPQSVNHPPQITNFYVDEGPFLENDKIHVTLVVNDPDEGESLTVKIYWSTTPEGFGYESTELTDLTPGTIPVNFQISEAGSYYIWAEVIDSKGASDTTRNYPQFADYERKVYENHVPSITLTATPSQGFAKDTTFIVTVSVDYNGDDAVRDDIDYVLVNFGNGTPLVWDPEPDSTVASTEITYSKIGEFVLTALVRDDAENEATSSAIVKILNREPSITIVATPAEFYRGDSVKFDLHVSDEDVGKADNESVEYTYEVKVDGTSWAASGVSLASSSVVDKYELVADKLGVYSIIATVTDSFGGVATDSIAVIATVVNYVPEVEIATEDVYYEDETFVATVNVIDQDVDKGYDTLSGTFTLVSGNLRVNGDITFDGTTGRIEVDGSYMDPVIYDLYVKVWDTPGGTEVKGSVMGIEVKSRLYASATLWYEWYDHEESAEASTPKVQVNSLTDEPTTLRINLRNGSDNFDKPATLVVEIIDTNIRDPKVVLEYRVNGGNIEDVFDDDSDGDGLYKITVSANEFGAYTNDVVTGDVYVVSGDDEYDRVKVAEIKIRFVEGNDPEITFATSSPVVDDKDIIEDGATITIYDESNYDYEIIIEKNGTVVGTKSGTNTGIDTVFVYKTDLYNLGLALGFDECSATFTVTVRATDEYTSDNEESWTFELKDQASPLVKATAVDTDNYYEHVTGIFYSTITEAYFTNADSINIKGYLFDYHLATGVLSVEKLGGLIVADELFDNNSEAGKDPWSIDWVSEELNLVLPPEGIYEISVVASDICGNESATETYIVVDRTKPVVTAALVATCTDSNASDTVNFDIGATDDWLLNGTGTYTVDFGILYATVTSTNDILAHHNDSFDHDIPSIIGSTDDKVDGEGTITVAAKIEYEGTVILHYEIYDKAGNKGTTTVDIFVDHAAPRIKFADLLHAATRIGADFQDIQFEEYSTITADATWDIEDFGGIATATIKVEPLSKISLSHNIPSGDYYSPAPTNTSIKAAISLLGGDYYPTDSVVGTITVKVLDVCASDTTDDDIGKWHTRDATYNITIDNLVFKDDDFKVFQLDSNSDGASPPCLYVRVGRSQEATVTDVTGLSIGVGNRDTLPSTAIGIWYGIQKIAEGATITVHDIGPDYVTYEIELEVLAGNNITDGWEYEVRVATGTFAIVYDDANFWNGYYATNVTAENPAPPIK